MNMSRQSLGQIFTAPAGVALVSLVGLVGALVGDGLSDWFFSLCLAIPALLFGACMLRSRHRRTD